MFLAKYDTLALYDIDMGKISIIDHEQLPFDKNSGWALIGNPEEPDSSLLDHEYFCILDYLFDIIQSTRQEKITMWKFISNEPNEDESPSEAIDICDYKIQKKNKTITKNHPSKHFRERGRRFQLTIGTSHLMNSG